MFPILVLGVALAIAAVLIAPLVTRHGAQKVGSYIVVGLGILAAMVALFALFTGRGNLTIGSLIVLAVALIVTLANSGSAGGGPRVARGPSGRRGGSSNVETAWLRMTLDHGSGQVAGDVLQGRFAGRRLEDLSVEEVLALLRECQSDDPQSAQLLEAYLDRAAPGWRGAGDGPGDAAGGGPMTEAEAYEVLGLEPGASEDDIREAHRRLMREHHPDRGGSTWLAARINQAKEMLLGEH